MSRSSPSGRFSADCSRRRSCLWRAGFIGDVPRTRSSVSRSRSSGAVAESVLAETARREHVEIAAELAPVSLAAVVTFVLAGTATQALRAAVLLAVLDVLGKCDNRANSTLGRWGWLSRFSADCSRRRSCLWRAGFIGDVPRTRSSVSRSRSSGAVAESVLAETARREHVEIAAELAPVSLAAIVTFVLAGAATQAHRAAVFVAVLDVLGKFDQRAKGTALSHCTSAVHPHRSENAAHHTGGRPFCSSQCNSALVE